MNRQLPNLLSSAAAAAVLAVSPLASAQYMDVPQGGDEARAAQAEAQRKPVVNEATQAFIKEAAKGNMAEIVLGKMAESQGGTAEVRQFGAQLAMDHKRANANLRDLAYAKHVDWPTPLTPSKEELGIDFGDAAGEDFDRAFLNEVTLAHRKTIENYRNALPQAQDVQVKNYIEKTLPVLQDHLDTARRLQDAIAQAEESY